ncbi:MAG: hypothetical protein AB1349_10085 [Elusimicrobiota bacterium]
MKSEMLKIGYDGANSTLMELLKDGSTLIYARLIGYKSTNKAIWSALHNHSLSITDGSSVYKGYETKYFSYSKMLPSGLSETVIISELAIPKYISETADTFYVLSRTKQPDYNLFFELLNKVSKVPLQKEWSEYLFHSILKETQNADGYVYSGISELKDSTGILGWEVEYSEEQLLKHISNLLISQFLISDFQEAKDGTA